MQQCVQDGFGILFPEADTVRLFGGKLNLSCITAVPQNLCRLRFIMNLSEKPDKGTPNVNDTTYREVAP